MSLLDRLKVWQGYPAAILTAFTPWLQPFQRLDLINPTWRPEIDAVANVLVALLVLHLMGREMRLLTPQQLRRRFLAGAALAALLLAASYLFHGLIIHAIDADWLILGNLPWSAVYVTFFLALAYTVFVALTALSS